MENFKSCAKIIRMLQKIKRINSSFILAFALSIVCLSPLSAFERSSQDLIQPGHFIYDALAAFSIETGTVSLADQAPISIAEALYYLSKFDFEELSPAAQKYYNQIYDYLDNQQLKLQEDIFSLGLRPEFNLDVFYKTNDNTDWNYNYLKRAPLISLPAYISIGNYISMGTIVEGQENKGQRLHNNNYSNLPIAVDQVDINFPSYGYFSTGLDFTPETHLNFIIGMGPQSSGRSINGSVIMSEYFTGASYANLKIYNSKYKYNMNVTQFNVDKYMYSHSMDFTFFNKIQFSAMEAMLVYAPLELRFLNPLTIFHGYTPWLDYTDNDPYHESNTCAYMCFKAAYNPVKYVKIYGIFAQDQFQTKYERDNWPEDSTPNAIGAQLGIESFIPAGEGYFHTWLEGCYTDPFLYIKEDPNWSLVRTYRENFGDLATFNEWIGSPFGPDTVSAQLNFGYIVPSKYEVTLSYLFAAHGEYSGTKVFTDNLSWGGHDNGANITYWPYPDKTNNGSQAEAKRRQSLIAPSGIPEYENRITIYTAYSFNNWCTINTQSGVVIYTNRSNIAGLSAFGGEFAVSVKIRIPKGITL